MLVTSPPYWGQRMSKGTGIENDPRTFVDSLKNIFVAVLPKLKESGIVWINVGDAYNTPVNWNLEDREYSTLGHDRLGLNPENTAYTKPRIEAKSIH